MPFPYISVGSVGCWYFNPKFPPESQADLSLQNEDQAPISSNREEHKGQRGARCGEKSWSTLITGPGIPATPALVI